MERYLGGDDRRVGADPGSGEPSPEARFPVIPVQQHRGRHTGIA